MDGKISSPSYGEGWKTLVRKTNNMAQQTAVEWYYEQTVIEGKTNYWELLEQAKQMEKEQITDAHIEGQRVFDKHPHTQWTNDQAEQYYNETYNK